MDDDETTTTTTSSTPGMTAPTPTRGPGGRRELTDEEYERLARLRHGQRRYLFWAAEQARVAGVTPTQHQMLLGIRAYGHPAGPTIREVAEFMFLRHNSAVELADRAESRGLVRRRRDPDDASLVRISLTEDGAEVLRSLTELHLRELAELAPTMSALWQQVAEVAAGELAR